jgi:hypothetical protein
MVQTLFLIFYSDRHSDDNEVVAVVRSWDKPKERGFEVAIAHLSLVTG